MNRLLILFLLISTNSFSQEHITFNLGTAAVLNYNQPIYKLKNETLKPIKFNGSLALMANTELEFKEHTFVIEGIYHFRRYGYKLDIKDEFYNAYVHLKVYTETSTFNLKYQRYLKRIKLLNARMYLTTSIGYSIINHTMEYARWKSGGKKGGSLEYWADSYFDENGTKMLHTTNACIGLNFSSQLKNRRKIDYGVNYNYEFESLPAMYGLVVTNDTEVYETSFETQPHYLMFYCTIAILRWENS